MSSQSHPSSFDGLLAYIDPRQSWVGYLVAAGAVLSIGLTLGEPSASIGLDLPARLLFWTVHVAAALFLFELAQIGLGRMAIFERLPPLVSVAAVGVVGGVLFSVFSLLFLDRAIVLIGDLTDSEPVSIRGFLDELRNSGAASILFWVLVNTPRLVIMAQQEHADGTEDEPPVDPGSASAQPATGAPEVSGPLLDLLSRLPRRLGTDIVAISAELHYLRVYTRKGEALILMSFGRAVKALSVIPGEAIHRSHWVALEHVVTTGTEGNRFFCRLDTGLELPVSRSSRARLRASLALRDQQQVRQAAEKMVPAKDAIK